MIVLQENNQAWVYPLIWSLLGQNNKQAAKVASQVSEGVGVTVP